MQSASSSSKTIFIEHFLKTGTCPHSLIHREKTYNGITPISSNYDLPRTGQSRKTQDSAPLNDLAGSSQNYMLLDSLSRVPLFQKQRWELHMHVWKALDGKGGKRGKERPKEEIM